MDMLRRVLAAIIYATGVCVVLYVAYFLPYIDYSDDDKSMSAVNNWALLVTRIVCILVASVLWAVRFSYKGSHKGQRLKDKNVGSS